MDLRKVWCDEDWPLRKRPTAPRRLTGSCLGSQAWMSSSWWCFSVHARPTAIDQAPREDRGSSTSALGQSDQMSSRPYLTGETSQTPGEAQGPDGDGFSWAA